MEEEEILESKLDELLAKEFKGKILNDQLVDEVHGFLVGLFNELEMLGLADYDIPKINVERLQNGFSVTLKSTDE
jgi:hypothetical protein